MMKLKHSLRIIVPKRDNDGVRTEKETSKLITDLTENFGGCTVYDSVTGFWIEDGIYADDNFVIEVFGKRFNKKYVVALGERIKSECRQKAVSIVVDGRLWII